MNMAVLQWNIRGLRSNQAELSLLLASHAPHVVCLQETKLSSPQYKIKNYTTYNQIYTDNQIASGGNSILIKNQTLHRQIQLHSTLQAVAVRITLHRPITICSVYIPPNYPLALKELVHLRNQLPPPFIILGDFNAHSPLWGNKPTDQKGKIIEDFLSKTNTSILNDKSPTFQNSSNLNQSSIDLTLCDPDLIPNFKWSALDDPHGSDHFPICITPDIPDQVPIPDRFNLKKADWDQLCIECLQRLNTSQTHTFDQFHEILLEIIENCIPKLSTKPRKNKCWFTEDCQKAITAKNKALRKFANSKTSEDLKQFKITRAQARRVIREAKRTSFKNYVSKINNNTPMHKVWKMVKKLKGTHRDTIKHTLKPDNSFAETEKTVANSIAFSLSENSSTENYNDKFKKNKISSEKTPVDFSSSNEESYNCSFSLEELKSCLSELSNTTPGPDQIHNEILKHLPDETLKLLLNIYNNLWHTQTFPNNWRLATIIPIPKPGKDHSDPSNYRPIALTNSLCKLMEKIINKRLMWFLETSNSLSNFQCGFRKNRSTMDHLVRLETFIRDAFIRKEHLVAIFFDLEKAFDTTWKHGILKDLHELGLRGNLPEFIRNFLKNRSFQVKIGSTFSDIHMQEEGVPQGSILSPLLFEIKINSITKALQDNMNCSLYVDDFLICYKSKGKIDCIERQLQLQLQKLESWANGHGFKFSTTKTNCVHFCLSHKCVRQPELFLYGKKIPVKKQARFLGVIFDDKLSFLPHLKDLKTRCQSALNALKVLSNPEWGGDTETLLHLYRSLVRSKLDYACPLYGSARKSYLKLLDPVQNQGLRLALGAFRTSPVESLQAEANEPSLELRRKKLSLQYALKLCSVPQNPAYKSVFGLPEDLIHLSSLSNKISPFGVRIQNDLKDLDFSQNAIEPFTFPILPPWKQTKPSIDRSLEKYNKDSTDRNTYQKAYKQLINRYPDAEQLFTDGSKNDTSVGAAAISKPNCLRLRKLRSEASVYSAEAAALEMALNIIEKSTKSTFLILTDSLSCLKSLEHSDTSDTRILKLLIKLHSLQQASKTVTFAWIPSHVGISGNETADHYAKEALSLPEKNHSKIPFSDFKHKIKEHITSTWTELWKQQKTNKLNTIQPRISPRKPLSLRRRESVIFTRLKIGHTHVTHKHLLEGEEAPFCVSCNQTFTVRHILTECAEFNNSRHKYFRCTDIKTLFEIVEPRKILNFVKEIGLISKI